MTPAERLQRSIGIASWGRQIIAGQIVAEKGPMDDERLKWEVALRVYQDEGWVQSVIRQRLSKLACEPQDSTLI